MGMDARATLCFGVEIDLESRSLDKFFKNPPADVAEDDNSAVFDWLWRTVQDSGVDVDSSGYIDGDTFVLCLDDVGKTTWWDSVEVNIAELANSTEKYRERWTEALACLEEFGPTDLLREPKWLLVPYYG